MGNDAVLPSKPFPTTTTIGLGNTLVGLHRAGAGHDVRRVPRRVLGHAARRSAALGRCVTLWVSAPAQARADARSGFRLDGKSTHEAGGVATARMRLKL